MEKKKSIKKKILFITVYIINNTKKILINL